MPPNAESSPTVHPRGPPSRAGVANKLLLRPCLGKLAAAPGDKFSGICHNKTAALSIFVKVSITNQSLASRTNLAEVSGQSPLWLPQGREERRGGGGGAYWGLYVPPNVVVDWGKGTALGRQVSIHHSGHSSRHRTPRPLNPSTHTHTHTYIHPASLACQLLDPVHFYNFQYEQTVCPVLFVFGHFGGDMF